MEVPHAKLERYIRSQQRRMADIQTDSRAHCSDISALLALLFSQAQSFFFSNKLRNKRIIKPICPSWKIKE